MKEKWDLSILYAGFDDPAFIKDMESFDCVGIELADLANNADSISSETLILRAIDLFERQSSLLYKLSLFCNLTYSADTHNNKASSISDVISAKHGESTAAVTKLSTIIAHTENLEELINSTPALEEYRYFLLNIKRDNRYLLSSREEAVFTKMNISGASAWENLQSFLTSTVTACFRGQDIPLSSVRNLAYDPDASVRRDAYSAELASYTKIQDSVAFSLNSIKRQVLTECELRGYDSPLQKSLYTSRMKEKTLHALLDAMQEYLPVFWKYLRAKAKLLGHENGLPWYDLFAPVGKNDTQYTIEEARDYLLNLFGKFDTQLHDMTEHAFNDGWIDFFPREGKVGGAFDCGIPSAKQSRILTNFSGSFSDIVTIAHELGHAFHDQQVFSHSILNTEYSMPVAETASTFNEILVVSQAIQMAKTKEEKLNLLESQLMDTCQIICDIYSRFLFEKHVFEARPNEFLSSDRLCELMLSAQKEAYGYGLDGSALHPYMWLCKSHYYSGSLSFYNYPYAFGGLFARGLYAKYLAEGPSFVTLYKSLLKSTSVCDVEDAALIAGIDLTRKDFWIQGLKSVSDDIELFCELI